MQVKVPKYIVAVSGGIDSVVLLDLLAKKKLVDFTSRSLFFEPEYKVVVAHFNHGIRSNSGDDARFVEELAASYDMEFELGEAKLGPNTSEAKARDFRYDFLRHCCKEYNSSNIITAHHQDDLIETALINLLRGTSWRGMNSLKEFSKLDQINIMRPLLSLPKSKLRNYADINNLKWVEDSTNLDQDYLRNFVRLTLVPAATANNPRFIPELIELIENIQKLDPEIELELTKLNLQNSDQSKNEVTLSRYDFIMWPEIVANEVVYKILRNLDMNWHPSKLQITKALHFIKTGLTGKRLEVGGGLELHLINKSVQFKKS